MRARRGAMPLAAEFVMHKFRALHTLGGFGKSGYEASPLTSLL